jgi:hypothetical protein
MKEKVLIFVHQPKTGGTTLKNIVKRQFRPAEVYEFNDVGPEQVQESVDRLRALPDDQKQRIRCVMGHMAIGIHRFLPREPVYLTMLRNPVERAISHFYHIHGSSQNWGYDELVEKNAGLDDYVRWYDDYGFSNLQTRCLVEPELEMWDRIVGPHPKLEASALEVAKKNLATRFAASGIQERFDESLVVMKKALGWGSIFYGRANVTRGRKRQSEISRKTIDRIEELNALDMELWKYADTLLDEQIERYGPGFRKDLQNFEVWNERYLPIRKFSEAVQEARIKVQLRTRLKRLLARK